MNMKPKKISDIRYYENPARTEYGSVSHNSLGSLYLVPFRSFGVIGARFACKLRECGFTLPDFDHVYVVFTPALPSGVVQLSTLKSDSRIRYVDVGLPLEEWNSLSDEGRHDKLVDLTLAAIEMFNCDYQILNDVANQLKKHRSHLEIVVKSKETASYRVDVSFQIRPSQEQSIAFVSYTDKQSGKRGQITLTKLFSADDVYPLCASIVVKNNTITIAPRSSANATITAQKYNVPLVVAVDAVLAAQKTE